MIEVQAEQALYFSTNSRRLPNICIERRNKGDIPYNKIFRKVSFKKEGGINILTCLKSGQRTAATTVAKRTTKVRMVLVIMGAARNLRQLIAMGFRMMNVLTRHDRQCQEINAE